ncbi:hypothetical protein F4212_15865, partial [Candidatus Poribacteria bacterium]|nr:hypothetical protein [Candidatus Poribacteria bacterium]
MKKLMVNKKITMSILMLVVVLWCVQTASYANIVSVTPGDDDTSLVVKFNFSYRLNASGSYSESFDFSWRQKSPQGEWESATKRYSVSWSIYYIPIRTVTATREYTIEGLIPNTTYEVRLDLGSIHEGTTNFIPLLISSTPSLTETTLDEGMVKLTLLYDDTYETDVSKISSAVTVSGIDGVTVDTASVQRNSDTEITVELDYNITDFDDDTALTFSLGSDAITDYAGDAFTAEILVTAIKEVVSALVESPLTESTLDESVVSLVLTGATFEQDISKIKEAVTVSGINGVTIDADNWQRVSDRKVTVKLDYDRTDFDTDTALTFSIASGAIANHNGELSTELSVTAIVETVAASVVSPLTEETLDGSIVTLKLTGIDYEQDISIISDALTVSGINGVTIDTTTVQRLSDQVVAVELDYDGTDFVRDIALIFSIASGAITDYNSTAFTTELLVTANRNEDILTIFWTDSGTDKIQRANLDGANVEDLVTQGLEGASSIALDVVGGKMYWTDWGTDKIQRSDLDGSNVEDLVTQGLDGLRGIALDIEAGKMYWADTGIDKIQRANLDGSNVEDLVTQGLD